MAHVFTGLYFHIVFSTKGREPLISSDLQRRLFAYISGITQRCGGKLIVAGGIEDHVHLLIRFPPTVNISDAIGKIKANSAKWVNHSVPGKRLVWQEGYSAFAVGAGDTDRFVRYINNQKEHHRVKTYSEEVKSIWEMFCKTRDRETSVAPPEGGAEES